MTEDEIKEFKKNTMIPGYVMTTKQRRYVEDDLAKNPYKMPSGVKYVQGYSGGSYIDYLDHNVPNMDYCFMLSHEINRGLVPNYSKYKDQIAAWGFKKPTHDVEDQKNKCFFYTKPFKSFAGLGIDKYGNDIIDHNFVTGCMQPGDKVEEGCPTFNTGGEGYNKVLTSNPNDPAYNQTKAIQSIDPDFVKTPPYTTLRNAYSNYCLDVEKASKNDGARAIVYECHGGDNQLWTVDKNRRLIAKHSDKCLEVPGSGAYIGKGTPVRQWACNDGSNQKWDDGANNTIKLYGTNFCLDAVKYGDDAGKLILWDCHGEDNQRWTEQGKYAAFSPKEQPIRNKYYHECLDVDKGSNNNETPINTYKCHGGDNQKWTYDDKRRLVAKHSGKCLDIPGPGAKQPKGTRVRQWDCNDGANQKWTYNPTNKSFKSEDDNGLCLDMIKSGDSAGNVILWDCHGGENQQWYI